ncbi:VOC family protein [Pseudomonas sp. R2.Fl]|nr:VOC family protein [Pseudomonas sp. R2.Fl]
MPARSIDHLVLPVVSIAAARERYEALGFTVAADARHPFGTENACVFLADGTYLEPLGVGDPATCEEAARAGNVFVARHRAFRFRRGEGLSAIAIATDDAAGDDRRFREAGLSAGDILNFSRPVKMPDGGESLAAFRLAFAADLRAPDFFLFNCQRINPLPADKSALTRHDNGVVSLKAVAIAEENPADFRLLLETAFDTHDIDAHGSGFELSARGPRVIVTTPADLATRFGIESRYPGRGLSGLAVVFGCRDPGVTERRLAASGVAFERRAERLAVPPAPGQGVTFIFEEQA